MAQPFRLYNSLSRSVEDFQPRIPGYVSLYVCGNTVYDHCHVGHARAMVVFDMVVRYLRSQGWTVEFVRNFTDVDDKIIHRAQQLGETPAQLAQRYIDAYREDCAALGGLTPDHEPRVSTSINEIIELTQSLVSKGHAYSSEGSVWFSVRSFDGYGKLSGVKIDELRSEDVGAKRDPADFALWKGAKPGEPSWDSPWGAGRPGWHIECSAMANSCLSSTIDIHGGGLDLRFPHHENEIAQSECGNGAPYARYWMHNGLLTIAKQEEGQAAKMGKSLGNVVNIRDAVAEFPGEALRLFYLQTHYRSPLPWSAHALSESLGMLARLYEAREVAEAMSGDEPAEQVAEALGADALATLHRARTFKERFHAAMDDDFNSAMALGHAFELARSINRFANHKKAKTRGGPIAREAIEAFKLLEAIGLMCSTSESFQDEVKTKRLAALQLTRDEVQTLIDDRSAARAAKDWSSADAIREQLEAYGIVVMDRADGVGWRVRV